MEFSQLPVVNRTGRIQHQIGACGCFGERHDITNAGCVGIQSDDPFNAKGNAAVGWCAILKGFQNVTKASLDLTVRQANALEETGLMIATVDTDATTADLPTVEDDVICLRFNGAWIAFQPTPILVFGAGEWMVHSFPTLLIFVVFQQRKI